VATACDSAGVRGDIKSAAVPCDGSVVRDTNSWRDFAYKLASGQVEAPASAILTTLHNIVTDAASHTYDRRGNPFIPVMRRTFYCPKAAVDRMRDGIFRHDAEVRAWKYPSLPTGEAVKGVPGFDAGYCFPEALKCPLKCPRA